MCVCVFYLQLKNKQQQRLQIGYCRFESYKDGTLNYLRLFLNQIATLGDILELIFFPETHENRRSFNLNALKSNSVFHFLKNVLEF